MKDFLVIANWKMRATLADSLILTEGIKNGLKEINFNGEVVLLPSHPFLTAVVEVVRNNPIEGLAVGGQDVSAFEQGSHTGAVGAFQLQGLVKYCLVGHSERRRELNETVASLRRKIKILLKHQIIPIVCLGEKIKKADSSQEIRREAQRLLEDLNHDQKQAVILAYEPVWAISSQTDSQAASGDYAEKIAQTLSQSFPGNRIIYGGSVTPKNIRIFSRQPHIHGVLVGQASLEVERFLEIIQRA